MFSEIGFLRIGFLSCGVNGNHSMSVSKCVFQIAHFSQRTTAPVHLAAHVYQMNVHQDSRRALISSRRSVPVHLDVSAGYEQGSRQV